MRWLLYIILLTAPGIITAGSIKVNGRVLSPNHAPIGDFSACNRS